MFRNFEVNKLEQTELQETCAAWFTRHIQEQLRDNDIPCLAEALMPNANGTSAVDITTINNLLQNVSKTITTSNTTCIAAIVQDLQSKAIMTTDPGQNGACCQAVFILCGWVTMLFRPKLQPPANILEIHPARDIKAPSRFRTQPVFPTSVGVDQGMLSFGRLLAAVGQQTPQRHARWMDGTLATTHAGGPSDAIRVSNVYFSNLVRVGKIRLEWVDSMTEHLALDERTRTLKLFKYPAYCALICLSEPDSVAFLNKLIGDTDYEDNSVSSSSSLGAISSQPPFDNFCREVLISMGVIFAQESRSRDEVKRFVAKWPQRLKEDALFGKLCARSWQDHILFQYLNSPPVRSNYSAQADFPFLGARLLRIQEYMDAQTPNDFGTLIFDRRDHLRYWTFMSIFIFGVLSVGFQVLQVALVTLQILLDAKGPQAT